MKVELGKGGSGAVLLTIVFTVLKLTGVINWAWVWVLSPIWISLILTVLILAFVFGVFVMVTLLGGRVTVTKNKS